MPRRSLASFYVRTFGRIIARSKEAAALVVSVSMHALGHAGLALAAGASARALLGGHPTLPGLAAGVAGKEGGLHAALVAACFGLAAAVTKALGGAAASAAQARVSAEVGAALRLAVLDAWLDGGARGEERAVTAGVGHARQRDQGVANKFSTPGVGERCGSLARGVTAMTAHVREIENGLRVGALGGARALAQLVPLAAVLVVIAPRLALGVLAVLAPFAVALGFVRRALRRASVRAARDAEVLVEAADEAVRHADLFRAYGAEGSVRLRLADLGARHAARAARVEGAAALLSGANEALGALALVLVLAAARAGLLEGVLDGPGIASFAVAFFLAYRPLRDLGDARFAWARAAGAYEALEPLLPTTAPRPREPREPSDPARARPAVGPRPPRTADSRASLAPEVGAPLAALEVRGLELGHGRADALSFRVEPGAIVAVVGASGVGKTTLLRTLLGLDAPRAGEVRFGGEDLAGRTPAARPFAWVPQDAPLVADTLAGNVALGARADGGEAMLADLGGARLVEELAGARLGAGGRAVSGGERQWIALARALATDKPVLLLDEPTSGLDPAAQAAVLAAVARLRGRRSVVLVTHRREPLAIADHVVALSTRTRGPGVTRTSRAWNVSPSST